MNLHKISHFEFSS